MDKAQVIYEDYISERVKSFKSVLCEQAKTEQTIVQKYIIHGTPYVFKDDEGKYFDLKHEIATRFSERPERVYMVGSAKLSFSIAPKKLWKPFSSESDIDIVIISEKIFNDFWSDLYNFNIELTYRNETEQQQYNRFLKYFFKGWIRPDLFPFNYPEKKEWFEYFKSISYGKYGFQKITGAIYYSFDFFEKYHMQNIKKIRVGVSKDD
jgi:hypothetical protein